MHHHEPTHSRTFYGIAAGILTGAAALSLAIAPLHASESDSMKSGPDMAKQDTRTAQMKREVHDAWLDGKLESAILFNRHLNSFAIDTKVENGTAWLTGAVESDIDRELAGEVAKSIEGIDKVENRLAVETGAADAAKSSESYMEQSSWRQNVANATLTATVKTRLLLNEHTSGLDINVDSMNGVVTLSGTVASEEEADLAQQIAANVEDTRDVHNRLQVDEGHSS